MARIASALRALEVPVIASPDLDVLNDETVLQRIVTSLGAEWEDLHEDWATVTAPLRGADAPRLVSVVYQKLRAAMEDILQDRLAEYGPANQRRVKEALDLANRPWDTVKRHGIAELHHINATPRIVDRLVQALLNRGIVLVHAGELESFGHDLGVPKGKNWLPAALSAGLHRTPAVQAHINRLLEAYTAQKTGSEENPTNPTHPDTT